MNALYLLLFIGGIFVALTILFYVWTVRSATFDYVESLEQLPFDSEDQ